MSEKEKQIIEIFASIIPKLSESDKSYLIGLGEGMAIKVESVEDKKVTSSVWGNEPEATKGFIKDEEDMRHFLQLLSNYKESRWAVWIK